MTNGVDHDQGVTNGLCNAIRLPRRVSLVIRSAIRALSRTFSEVSELQFLPQRPIVVFGTGRVES